MKPSFIAQVVGHTAGGPQSYGPWAAERPAFYRPFVMACVRQLAMVQSGALACRYCSITVTPQSVSCYSQPACRYSVVHSGRRS